jgi:hypothetical protein
LSFGEEFEAHVPADVTVSVDDDYVAYGDCGVRATSRKRVECFPDFASVLIGLREDFFADFEWVISLDANDPAACARFDVSGDDFFFVASDVCGAGGAVDIPLDLNGVGGGCCVFHFGFLSRWCVYTYTIGKKGKM